MDLRKSKYTVQKACAKKRNIDFHLTFDEWWNIWEQSGKYEQRGCRKGQYVMSRYNDSGAYELDNVIIKEHSHNIKEAQTGRTRTDFSMIMKNKWDNYRSQNKLIQEI